MEVIFILSFKSTLLNQNNIDFGAIAMEKIFTLSLKSTFLNQSNTDLWTTIMDPFRACHVAHCP